jgi:hypothetical protein
MTDLDIKQALALQRLIEQVAEQIKDFPNGRSYLTPEGDAYVLAFGREHAQEMATFMRAVGQYLLKMKKPRGDKEAAKTEVLRAFDEWLAKQKV